MTRKYYIIVALLEENIEQVVSAENTAISDTADSESSESFASHCESDEVYIDNFGEEYATSSDDYETTSELVGYNLLFVLQF